MSSTNNKRIAKNTIALYCRMIVLMLVNLFTSRVILEALGFEDYGIYNVVGGFVGLFAVISQSLSSASSRFLSFEIGKGDEQRLKAVFSTSLFLQILLIAIIFLLSEIIGVWYVNYKMVVDASRIIATNWVLQFSIIAFCFNLLSVPYNAAIVAHEKMSAFAYISLFEGLAKLGVSYLICFSPFDKLIYYAFLILVVQVIVRFIYSFYCVNHFAECKKINKYDKSLVKEMLGYSGWNIIGAGAVILRTQGTNVLLNFFGGPLINAALSISMQIYNAIAGFSGNFITALRPQITMNYASGNFENMKKLCFQGTKFSTYFLLLLSIPLIFNIRFILHIWLGNVPAHADSFAILLLIFNVIESMSNTIIVAQLATGKVKLFQLVVGFMMLLNLPVSYVLLHFGLEPEAALFVSIVISVICLSTRLIICSSYIKQIAIFDFYCSVILKVIKVSFFSCLCPIFICKYVTLDDAILNIISIFISFLSTMIVIYFLGCTREERKLVNSKILQFVYKI